MNEHRLLVPRPSVLPCLSRTIYLITESLGTRTWTPVVSLDVPTEYYGRVLAPTRVQHKEIASAVD